MRKIMIMKKSRLLVVGAVILMAGSIAQAELIIAGWDSSYALTAGGSGQAADQVETGIVAEVVANVVNSFARSNGSTDLTFGTFAGAANNTESTGLNDGTRLQFTVTNTGSSDYELTRLRFDHLASWANTPSLAIDVVSGDITHASLTNLVLTGIGSAPTTGNWDDTDISLTGLADHTLAAGQSATFRIITTGVGAFIDNVGVTGSVIPEPATIGMLGLGGLIALLLRRMKR